MRREIFVETFLGQKRMAVLEDGLLAEYTIERPGQEKLAGNIYKGSVRDILPGMQAAFVDIGLEKNGYLFLEDIAAGRGDVTPVLREQMRRRGSTLRRGQEIIVQVTKETSGGKGPRISGNVTLPGALLVFLPTLEYTGVSRKITDPAERVRLAAIADRARAKSGGGMIVRTAAQGASEEVFAREAEALAALWESIRRRAEYSKAPTLLYSDALTEFRVVRDLLTTETDRVWFDDPATLESARSFAQRIAPEGVSKLALYPQDKPMFETERLDAKAKKALERRVVLPSGVHIVIDHTEALTAIDVNTGSFVGNTNDLEDTVYAANREAAEEIARQLRLRDIGGIVVVDFIDMEDPAHEKGVLEAFTEALDADRARTNLVGFTGLGLVELTRRKFQQPIYRLLNEPCDACEGGGWVLSAESAAREGLRKLYARTLNKESGLFLVCAAVEVAARMLALGRDLPVNAWVYTDKTKVGNSYDISPASSGELPKAAQKLGRGI